ncbi:MAG TPA: DUF4232 domain-containing protein [Mycobacteriales bacterium]|nr:DUF4232 domain-containing protein [Mycobacteriales bacterium]
MREPHPTGPVSASVRASVLAPGLVALTLLAGCGVAHPTTAAAILQPASPSPSPAHPTALPSATRAVKAPPAPKVVGAAAGLPACATGELSAGLAGTQGAAGHILDVFSLTNRGTGSCRLDGYPGLALLDRAGRGLPTDPVHGADMAFPAVSAHPVVLNAGQAASFSVGYSDVPSGAQPDCSNAAALAITPPGQSSALRVATALAPCGGGRLDVSPVVAGSHGVPS